MMPGGWGWRLGRTPPTERHHIGCELIPIVANASASMGRLPASGRRGADRPWNISVRERSDDGKRHTEPNSPPVTARGLARNRPRELRCDSVLPESGDPDDGRTPTTGMAFRARVMVPAPSCLLGNAIRSGIQTDSGDPRIGSGVGTMMAIRDVHDVASRHMDGRRSWRSNTGGGGCGVLHGGAVLGPRIDLRGLEVHSVARTVLRRRCEPPAKPPVAARVGECPSPAGGWNSAGT